LTSVDSDLTAAPKIGLDQELRVVFHQSPVDLHIFEHALHTLMAAPRDPAKLVDVDQWWVEHRLVARKLLDLGNARLAYEVANAAANPEGRELPR
jgi:hypothetical protein